MHAVCGATQRSPAGEALWTIGWIRRLGRLWPWLRGEGIRAVCGVMPALSVGAAIVNGQLDSPDGPFRAVSAGAAHSCGIRTDGGVVCWGSNVNGQLDSPDGSFRAVSAGAAHSCAVRSDGGVTCWGDGAGGVLAAPRGDYQAVSAGTAHSCAVRSDGTVSCWGNQESGAASACPVVRSLLLPRAVGIPAR